MQRYNFTNPLFLKKIESMMRRFYIICCLVFLVACDDGDILEIDLEFSQELERCENDTESYLIYDTRNDPNESLSLIIARNTANELLFTEPTDIDNPIVLDISNSATRFIYRTYNRSVISDELCDIIAPGDLTIVEDFEATTGSVTVTSTIIDDDNDGIPSELEYGPGGIENPRNSDDDIYPDYIDPDDDNDNVLTIDELNDDDNADGDDDPLTNMLDTDNDGLENYRDNDDDGDNIPTRLEDQENEMNPRSFDNFVVDVNGINVYRYLYNHPSAEEAFDDTGFIFNVYTRTVQTTFLVSDVNLGPVTATVIEFGTYENSFIITNEPED